ncbi:dihydrofolate reductase [Flagellimonas nanhaiensis]|uniref:Dihydrofolate reductase n=1 Tax=Flagellimonas nanhaiensis TaxID=2292706 RepID=A0A371JNR3_9FLAO|nr:dihydrofolate reductase [Allomuricauda nanhaiensis]RDY58810.1 dihydrofolate reductase [Allomuricauda nanhaiensis]
MKRLIIIAAAGENNALGIDNDLPWHLPDDFKRFKSLTSGHKIIMGRKTLESFPKALPKREHIVVTRDRSYTPKFPCVVVHSLESATALVGEDETAFIIGGGEIYRQAMDFATDIELTRIHADFEADTFFPEVNDAEWELIKTEYHPSDNRHKHDFTYLTYQRR